MGLTDGSEIPCLVQVHPLKVEEQLDQFKEKRERQLQWFFCSEADALVEEPELKGLFKLLAANRSGRGSNKKPRTWRG